METVTNEQFLLSCISNSDLTKVDHAKVAKELGLPSTGAATKRWSRWKAKIQAELAKGPDAATAGDGDGDDGAEATASPKKPTKTPTKKAAAAGGPGGSAKKASAKKTPAKKRKLEEVAEEDEGGAVKDEPNDADEDEV